MTVTDRPAGARALEPQRLLYGWGRTAPTPARVTRPTSIDEVSEIVSTGASVLARGAGRSYGDAAQNAGGHVLDMTGLDRVISIDAADMSVRVQAGATLAQVLTALGARRLTLPVVPGTCQVTVGGAIASDVHGKNHHRDGSFGVHVRSLALCTPQDRCREVSPGTDPPLFWATLGGMGLTGVVVEATLGVEALPSRWVAVDSNRTNDLEQTVELLSSTERHRYSVAWLDLLAAGRGYGRAVIERADPWPLADGVAPRRWRSGRADPRLVPAPRVQVPERVATRLLPTSGVRTFNALRWSRAPRRERARPLARAPYLFPLDVLGGWNRLYGPAGMIQYQFVVPDGAEEELLLATRRFGERRLPVYLAVFKRFGPAADGPLSFPLAGWTVAVDLPADAPGLHPALDELDELIAGCGGRVYLTKDARLRRDVLHRMYPRLTELREQCARVDPHGVLGSDLSRRLALLEDGR
jgi:decaprenylphospho-beta-D-ribofuranose 2-oxidase